MTKDKLTERERLNDFIWFLFNNQWLKNLYIKPDQIVDNYLKSINQSSNEALTLDTIEHQKKVCPACNGKRQLLDDEFNMGYLRCATCNGEGQID